MNKKILIAFMAVVLVLGTLAACKKGEEKPAGKLFFALSVAGFSAVRFFDLGKNFMRDSGALYHAINAGFYDRFCELSICGYK